MKGVVQEIRILPTGFQIDLLHCYRSCRYSGHKYSEKEPNKNEK